MHSLVLERNSELGQDWELVSKSILFLYSGM